MYPLTGKILHDEISRLKQQIRETESDSYTDESYRQSLLQQFNNDLNGLQKDVDKLNASSSK